MEPCSDSTLLIDQYKRLTTGHLQHWSQTQIKDLGDKKPDIEGWVVKTKSKFDEVGSTSNRKEETDLTGQLKWMRLRHIQVQDFQK